MFVFFNAVFICSVFDDIKSSGAKLISDINYGWLPFNIFLLTQTHEWALFCFL